MESRPGSESEAMEAPPGAEDPDVRVLREEGLRRGRPMAPFIRPIGNSIIWLLSLFFSFVCSFLAISVTR